MLATILIPLCLWTNCQTTTYEPQAVIEYVDTRHTWPQSVEQWRPLVAGQFQPEDVETALCLIYHESRGDPTADNPRSTARGLFQILSDWAGVYGVTYADLHDPSINTYIAARLRYAYGWSQWSPWNRGECHGL